MKCMTESLWDRLEHNLVPEEVHGREGRSRRRRTSPFAGDLRELSVTYLDGGRLTRLTLLGGQMSGLTPNVLLELRLGIVRL